MDIEGQWSQNSHLNRDVQLFNYEYLICRDSHQNNQIVTGFKMANMSIKKYK